MAREIVEGFVAEVEVFGFVPNYNGPKSVCSSRSQSPFLTSAIREVYPSINDPAWLDRAVSAAATEYCGYWLAELHMTKTGLSRYIDVGVNGGTATVPDSPHYRAIGESGWDNTPRFGDNATQVIPVDLNCQLYRYELDLADFSDLLGKKDKASVWRARADKRRDLINRYLWDETSGFYWDYDLCTGERLRGTPRSLASFVSLWAGVADQDQAARVVEHLPAFEYDHGLVACEQGWGDETEHNYPTGWPYSHWYVCSGLRAYGFDDEASRIAMKWVRLVSNEFARTGAIRERHNVVDPSITPSGRYPPQRGFAWTNGVFASLLVRIIFGIEVDGNSAEIESHPSFPREWAGEEIQICLPSYPWPEGVILRQVAALEDKYNKYRGWENKINRNILENIMKENYVEAYRQSKDMKAVGLTRKPDIGKVAETIELFRISTPKPKLKEAVVKVLVTTIFSDDIAIAQGTALGRFLGPKNISKENPFIIGNSFAGIVVAIGDEVSNVKIGDEVVDMPSKTGSRGAWAEYRCVKATQLLSKPQEISFENAALSIVAGSVAYGMFKRSEVKAGNRCLIIGASGGIGSVLVQLLKAKGAYVIGICSGRNEEFVRSMGADEVIDYHKNNFADNMLRKNESIDLAFDSVGGKQVECDAYKILTPKGRYITVCGPEQYIGERKLSWPEVIKMFGYITWRLIATRLGGPRYIFSEIAPAIALKPIIDLIIKHDIQIPTEDIIPLELDAMKNAVAHVASHRVRGRIAIKP